MNLFKKSILSNFSIVNFVFAILFFFLFYSLSGWNYDNADYYNYEVRYNRIETYHQYIDENYGMSYSLLFFKRMGLDFFHTRLYVYCLSFILFCFFIYKCSYNSFFIFFFYFFFRFIRDVVELKNFLASVVILYACLFLYFQNIKCRLLSLLLILVSSSFHIAYYLFIPFVFLNCKKKLNIFFFFISFSLLSFFSKPIMDFIFSIYSSSFLESRREGLDDYTGMGAFLASSFVVLGSIIVFKYFYKRAKQLNGISHLSIDKNLLFLNNLNAWACCLLIFSAVTFSFVCRLYTSIIIINIIFFCNFLYLNRKNSNILDITVFVSYCIISKLYLDMEQLHTTLVLSNNLLFENLLKSVPFLRFL